MKIKYNLFFENQEMGKEEAEAENVNAEMDAQPIQGENIEGAKREIEATLDTLNLAFEKLLDSVFKDTAMDVSSDISVLNTLLAQEGLTEDEFSQMKNQQ